MHRDTAHYKNVHHVSHASLVAAAKQGPCDSRLQRRLQRVCETPK